MPVPTPSNVIRVRLIHGLGTDVTIGCRFYVAYTDASAPSIADLNSMASGISSLWGTNLAGQMTSSGGLEGVIVDDLASATGNQGSYSTLVSGTRAGTYFDQMQAVQLNFKIGRHYRGGKPKVFLPYLVEGDDAATGNKWLAASANGVATAWNNFMTALNGHAYGGITVGAQQSVSYFHGAKNNPSNSTWARRNVPAPRGTPVVDPVIAVTASQYIRNLRKRTQQP